MNTNDDRLSIAEAKNIDLVGYLSMLGHHPAKISRSDYWYFSPFHQERTPSFKINRNLNRWYDFSIGKGGNLVDFGILYYNCSVRGFLQKLRQQASPLKPLQKSYPAAKHKEDRCRLTLVKCTGIRSVGLTGYLKERGIAGRIARRYCVEIHYRLYERTYYAIGFKNNSGGYELRNKYFKGSVSPKDFTFINHGQESTAVFEGFFDFLSYQTICEKTGCGKSNFLILNSTAFFDKALEFLQDQKRVCLFLDRDATGQNCTRKARQSGRQFIDKSKLYKGYKDLNDWLVQTAWPTDKIAVQKVEPWLKSGD